MKCYFDVICGALLMVSLFFKGFAKFIGVSVSIACLFMWFLTQEWSELTEPNCCYHYNYDFFTTSIVALIAHIVSCTMFPDFNVVSGCIIFLCILHKRYEQSKSTEILPKMMKKLNELYTDIHLPQLPTISRELPFQLYYADLQMRRISNKACDEASVESYEMKMDTPPNEEWWVNQCQTLLRELTVDVHELFDKTKNGMKPRRILIEGAPAIGKSTLCRKLLSDWSLGRDYLTSKFKLVFLLNVDSDAYWQFVECTHWQCALVKTCSKTTGLKFPAEEILRFLVVHEKEVLLILEGFDELMEHSKRNLRPLLEHPISPFISIIVMTRNGALHENHWDMKIKISGIDRTKRKDCFLHCGSAWLNDLFPSEAKFIDEICYFPIFLHILRKMRLEGILGKKRLPITTLFAKLFDSILVMNMYRSGESVVANINVVDALLDTDNYKHPAFEIIKYGGRALDMLKNNTLMIKEVKIMKGLENKQIFELGLWIKKCQKKDGYTETVYKAIHKGLLEFMAALATVDVLTEFGEEELKLLMRERAEALPPYDASLYYVFVGGLLNAKAYLIFEVLLPFSCRFNMTHVGFAQLLSEIKDIHSFNLSFQKLLPSFVPSYYSLGHRGATTENLFFSSPLYCLLFSQALELGLIRLLHWLPPYSTTFKNSLTMEHLLINVTDDICDSRFIEQCALLKCKRLSLKFLKLTTDNWTKFVQSVNRIKTDQLNVICHTSSCINSLVLCLHNELTKGSWKEKNIDRLKLTLHSFDGCERCLQLLIDLVKKGKISKGVNLTFCFRRDNNEQDKFHALITSLFQSVDASKAVDELCVFICFVDYLFHLGRSRREVKANYKSLRLAGCFPIFQCSGREKVSVEEASALSHRRNCDSDFIDLIRNFKRLQYFSCRRECIDSLIGKIEITHLLTEIKELNVHDVTGNPFLWIDQASQPLANLQVLTLRFLGSDRSFSSSVFQKSLIHLLSTLNLRILELFNVPCGDILECVVDGTKERRRRLRSPCNGEEFLLQELLLDLNPHLCDFLTLRSESVEGIRILLRTKLLRRCSWLSDDQEHLSSLFPFRDGFRIACEIEGMDPCSSRRSQYEFRWLNCYVPMYSVSYVHQH